MITSTFLIFSLLVAPDLYFKRANGDIAVASGRGKHQQRQICVKSLLSDGTEIEVQGTISGFYPSVSLRYSVADDGVWILDISHNTDSGLRSFDAGALINFSPIDELKQEQCFSGRLKDIVLQKAKTPSDRIGKAISKMLSQQERNLQGSLGRNLFVKMPDDGPYQYWGLSHYSELVSPLNTDEIPYATITAVDPEKAIASIYVSKSVVFIELRRRKLSAVEITEFKKLSFGPFFDFAADALEWNSLGVAETDLNSWATGIWSDDSLNLVGDDGYCERFKLVDGTFKRTGQTSGLPAPSAICHVGSDIWLLSEKDEAIKATKVSWDGSTSHSEFNLVRTSLDAAAQIVFDPDELAWRVNYSLFISVLPFLIAALVVLFVIWRVVKARRLSRSG